MVYKSLAVSSPVPSSPAPLSEDHAYCTPGTRRTHFLEHFPRGIINYPVFCWVCKIDVPSAVGLTTLSPLTLSGLADGGGDKSNTQCYRGAMEGHKSGLKTVGAPLCENTPYLCFPNPNGPFRTNKHLAEECFRFPNSYFMVPLFSCHKLP